MELDQFTKRYKIPQNEKYQLSLQQKLVAISARQYFFNIFTRSEMYLPKLEYWEYNTEIVTENAHLLLQMISHIPPKNSAGIRILALEMELVHGSLLVLNYNNQTFYTIDPIAGCSQYDYMEFNIIPILAKMLGWKYDRQHIAASSCKGPQDCTKDDFCYIWSLLIARILSNYQVSPNQLINEMYGLSSENLKLLIDRFINSLYDTLFKGGWAQIYGKINLNEARLCYHLNDQIVNTCSSLIYYYPKMTSKKLMERVTDEFKNFIQGCERQALSKTEETINPPPVTPVSIQPPITIPIQSPITIHVPSPIIRLVPSPIIRPCVTPRGTQIIQSPIIRPPWHHTGPQITGVNPPINLTPVAGQIIRVNPKTNTILGQKL